MSARADYPATAVPALGEIHVSVRLWGGAYIARVRKSRAVASCTVSAEDAARRAAGKHLRVVPEHVALREIPTSLPARYAFAAVVLRQTEGGAE